MALPRPGLIADVGEDKMKWIKLIVIFALGAVTMWLVWKWAMPPGWWAGSMMSSVGETDDHIARRYFGPIILQTDMLVKKGNYPDAFRLWGQMETVYRLVVIIIGQFVVAATAIILMKTNRQPSDAPRQ